MRCFVSLVVVVSALSAGLSPLPVAAADGAVAVERAGTSFRVYAGEVLPQGVVVAPSGDLFLAVYAPDQTAQVLQVTADGTVLQRETLRVPDGSPARFTTGTATTASSNGNLNDSHNNLTVGVDRRGDVHVAGNVHNAPLQYWRTTVPGDLTSLRNSQTLGEMRGVWVVTDKTGRETKRYLAAGAERGATSYPTLFTGPAGQLFMMWRGGMAGTGNTFLLAYDEDTSRWSSVAGQSMAYAPYRTGFRFWRDIPQKSVHTRRFRCERRMGRTGWHGYGEERRLVRTRTGACRSRTRRTCDRGSVGAMLRCRPL